MVRSRRLVLVVAATGLGLAAGAILVRPEVRQPRGGASAPTAAPTSTAAAARRDGPRVTGSRDADASPAEVADAVDPGAAAAPVAQAPDPRTRPVADRRIFFPADAAPRAGALPDVTRRLLDEHRDVLGLDRIPGELRVAREETSISGHHLRLRQFVGGVPVQGSEVSAHVAMDGRPVMLAADAFPVGDVVTTPRIAAADAVLAVRAALVDVVEDDDPGTDEGSNEDGSEDGGEDGSEDGDAGDRAGAASADSFECRDPELWILPEGKSGRLVWRVDARTGDESARVVVDATDGALIDLRDLRVGADGDARVFNPNPVFSTRNGALRDKRDAYQPVLDAAMVPVKLHRLDGTGRLRGQWCDAARGSGDGVHTTYDWSVYSRDDAEFELANAYHHVDQTQERIRALGITDANATRQKVAAHALHLDQSYYDLYDQVIRFGDGGVDDAEDGDIVVHEYGHSIQHGLVDDFGSTGEGAAVAEGSSDFLACAMHATGDDKWDPLVGSWDATSYSNTNPPFLRRVDRAKVYPRSLVDESHEDGEIWSRLLWDVRSVVGGDDGIRLSIEALRYMTGDAQFRQAANALLTANIALRAGRDDEAIRRMIRARGLPFTVPPAGTQAEDDYEDNDDSAHATPLATGTSTDLVLADDDWFQVSAPPFTRVRVQAHFDAVDLDLDLELRTATGAFVEASRKLGGKETVDGVAGSDGATWFVRASRGSSVIGIASYRLDVMSLPLETVRIGRTTLRRMTPGARDAVVLSVGRAKVDSGARLVVRSTAQGRRGAVNDVRIVSPSGRVAVDFGRGAKAAGARVVVAVDEVGAWRVEVRARGRTSGAYTLAAKFRR